MNGLFALLAVAPLFSQGTRPASRPADGRRVRVGETVSGALDPADPPLPGHGPSRRFEFVADSDGPVTLSLESVDFDAFLRVETEGEEKLAEDDNGGVETNARIVLAAARGTKYRLLLAAAREGAGEFSFSLANGERPTLSGAALLEAGAAFHAEVAERALARGDKRAAARHRLYEGSFRSTRAQFAEARAALEASLALAQSVEDRAVEAMAHFYLGTVRGHLGEYAQSRECYGKARALHRELGDRGRQSSDLAGLSMVEELLGNYGSARAFAEECLELARESGNPIAQVESLVRVGGVHSSLGDHPRARELFDQALTIARKAGRAGLETEPLAALGATYHLLGDYGRAREYLEEALGAFRRLGAPAGEARVLGNLGALDAALENYVEARKWVEDKLELSRRIGNRPGEERALVNLGVIHCALKDYARAREFLEEGVLRARELRDREGEGVALDGLGMLHLALDEYGEARERAEEARECDVAIGRQEGLLHSQFILARAAVAQGDAAAAAAALGEAEVLLDRLPTRGLGTEEGSMLRSRFSFWSQIAQDLTALRLRTASADDEARSRLVAEGFAQAGRWKGRGLLEGIAEHRSGARSPEANRLRRERKEILASRARNLERVGEAIQRRRPPEEVDRLREEGRSLLARAEELGRRLAEVSPRDAALDLPQGATPESVRAALGHRTALVEFAEGKAQLHAYVVTGKDLRFLELGPREEVEKAVHAFLSCVAIPDSLCSVEQVRDRGRRLFETLLAPAVRPEGKEVDRLVIVPSAMLASLPFEALVTEARGNDSARTYADLEFVLDRYEVCYAPSSPVFVDLVSSGPRRAEGKALVLADPLYSAEGLEARVASRPTSSWLAASATLRGTPDPESLPRLERTRQEARAIARERMKSGEASSRAGLERLDGERSGTVHSERLDLHWGAQASRHALEGDLRRYDVVHLAAHGFVDRRFPRRTGIALAGGEGEEGYLTIADVLELDLDANLVVLSACTTAQGEYRGGEGVESMARAFLYAGARGVVASLWRVEDRAGAETMSAFYRSWDGRRGASRALREAKLAVRRWKELPGGGGAGAEGAPATQVPGHPFLWAPFIYVGLPR
ncbi:MAG TPA: CHAT domain-containing tetratricopeptide repeat protein [Planctomycetota bacterium]|jgi:CHAT domain-containing protein/tetratricopeptide (TPR) repeat protein|nr:CHAT domain-containing tetratricopeptide repeat protein [Planctomycetota bacterium]